MTDTELIDWLEKQEGVGLISDDMGHWAVSSSGFSSLPENPPDDVTASFFVTKNEWRKNIRDAILAYKDYMDDNYPEDTELEDTEDEEAEEE